MQKKPLEKNIKKYGQDWIGSIIEALNKAYPLTKEQKILLRNNLMNYPAYSSLQKNKFFEDRKRFVICHYNKIENRIAVRIQQFYKLTFVFEISDDIINIVRYDVTH